MDIELLAPAGSYESMVQDFDAGADAVYLGGSMFGARAYAPNFQREELLQAIDEAHGRGRRLYLTVNTLLKNQELYGKLYDYLLPYYRHGLDAVIVQDYGVLSFLRTEFPGLHIHASTQMTVTGAGGAKFLESAGVNRVVTARELSLTEIQDIRRETSLEIESFVHGALCYSYSGQCLFSSLLGGRSGNRGRCAQPCRLPYEVFRGREKLSGRQEVCPLSPKDMCTVDLLPRIIEAGVTSLKIEGRMKQPAYTAGVVNIYRKYLDYYLQGKQNIRVDEEDRQELLALFNRGGFNKGYYEIRNGRDMMAFTNEKKTGKSVRKIYKIKEKIKGILILYSGKNAILELFYRDIYVRAEGDEVQRAQKQPVTSERVKAQMEKTGATPFDFEELEIRMDTDVFMPMGALNQLRRDAFQKLQDTMTGMHRRPENTDRKAVRQAEVKHVQAGGVRFLASCETRDQALALMDIEELEGIYCPQEVIASLEEMGVQTEKDVYMTLPHISRARSGKSCKEITVEEILDSAGRKLAVRGYLVRNLEDYAYLRARGLAEKCVLDSSLYTFNDQAVGFWKDQGILRNTAPLELNQRELAHRDNADSELIIYGYLPMMISAQCVQKNMDACRKDNATLTLRDRYAKDFSVKCYCDFCYNVIYNSLPYGLLKEAPEVKKLGFSHFRLSFTTETGEQTGQIARDFIYYYNNEAALPLSSGAKDKKQQIMAEYDLTKGHFKRGVE